MTTIVGWHDVCHGVVYVDRDEDVDAAVSDQVADARVDHAADQRVVQASGVHVERAIDWCVDDIADRDGTYVAVLYVQVACAQAEHTVGRQIDVVGQYVAIAARTRSDVAVLTVQVVGDQAECIVGDHVAITVDVGGQHAFISGRKMVIAMRSIRFIRTIDQRVGLSREHGDRSGEQAHDDDGNVNNQRRKDDADQILSAAIVSTQVVHVAGAATAVAVCADH